MKFPSTNIVLLAAGHNPDNFKDPNYVQRHLTLKKDGSVLIGSNLNSCIATNCPVYVVVDEDNKQLISYLADNFHDVGILYPADKTIISSFRAAFSVPGRCLMISGDLVNLRSEHIFSFLYCKFESACCRYSEKWGKDIVSKTSGRKIRGNAGPSLNLFDVNQKSLFLSDENIKKAESLFQEFYPSGNQYQGMNPYVYNDYGTFLNLAHMEELLIKETRLNRIKNLIKSVYAIKTRTISPKIKGLVYIKGRLFEDVDNSIEQNFQSNI